MDENPYAELVGLMRTQAKDAPGAGPVRMRLGQVVSAAPLCVEVAGLRQPASALWLNGALVKGAKRKVRLTSEKGTLTGVSGGDSLLLPGSARRAEIVMERTEAELEENALEAGDRVLLLTEDDQTFYLIAKVGPAG